MQWVMWFFCFLFQKNVLANTILIEQESTPIVAKSQTIRLLQESGRSEYQYNQQIAVNPLNKNLKNIDLNQSERCLKPARFAKGQQGFTLEMLNDCKDLSAWLKHKPMRNVALVYAGSYLGTPSSAFGHTFLLVWDQNPLSPIATVIDYSGDVPRSVGGKDYLVGGLMGHFPGRFNIMPLASKTFSYGIQEGRSLQVFPLKLARAQIERVWLNLWEMNSNDFKYYFLKENCSYKILYLLSLVDNSIEYINSGGIYTIPGDTAKILNESGLIQSTVIFPSLNKLAAQDHSSLHPNAWLFARYDFQSAALPDWSGAEQVIASDQGGARPQQSSILDSHGSKRVVVGFATDNAKADPLLVLGFRPLYHSETDPVPGFDKGNALELLSGSVLIGPDNFEIDRLDLLRLRSLTPAQGFMAGRLWQLELALQRRIQLSGFNGLESLARFGVGRNGDFGPLSLWSMAHLGLEKRQEQHVNLTPQLEVGAAWQSGRWQVRSQVAVDLSNHFRRLTQLDFGFGLSQDQSLNLVFRVDQWQANELDKIQMEWRRYF